MIINDITITSLETITAFDLTGAYRFTVDELQNTKIANTQEKTDVTGKGGRKLNSLKKNKAVVISGTNGLISGGMLEMQTGSNFTSKNDAPISWTDYLTITSNSAVTSYKAVGAEGHEIETVYIKNSDGTLGETLTQDSTAGTGKFAYNPSTKVISFASGAYADGTEIVVFYTRNINANVLENISDTYSEKCQLYIDAFGEDKCGVVYRVQFYIPKADFSGNFDFDLGDNQAVHAFEAESLAGTCGNGGTLWTYTVFGANQEDSSPAKVLTGIAISGTFDNSYSVGETFDPTDMVVTATYADSTTATLNGGSYLYAPNGALAATDTAITVTYTENGVTKTATAAITVS